MEGSHGRNMDTILPSIHPVNCLLLKPFTVFLLFF
jgi:hypothetical protein